MAVTSLRSLLLASLLLSLSPACSGDLEPDGAERLDLLYAFDENTHAWSGNFTDLAPNQVDDVGFVFEHRQLPPETGLASGALFVSGRNVSDDLFMFFTRLIIGLIPDTLYDITFELELASNSPTGCVGVGGAPGESVYLKVGAATVQPDRLSASSGYRLNVDKGNQSTGGANAQVLGNLANGSTDCGNPPYRLITRDNRASPFRIKSDSQGQLWLLVGTDSGYESTTALYYDTIRVVLEPVQQ